MADVAQMIGMLAAGRGGVLARVTRREPRFMQIRCGPNISMGCVIRYRMMKRVAQIVR